MSLVIERERNTDRSVAVVNKDTLPVLEPITDRQNSLELARRQYEQDWIAFLFTPNALLIKDQFEQKNQQLKALKTKEQEETTLLKDRAAKLRGQRAQKHRVANSVRDHYGNARGTRKRYLYDILAWTRLLTPVAEKIYPLKTTQNRYREIGRTISRAEQDLKLTTSLYLHERSNLEEEKQTTLRVWQNAKKEWIIQDKTRLFIYVIDDLGDNQAEKDHLFRCFAESSGSNLEILNQEFEIFTGSDTTIEQKIEDWGLDPLVSGAGLPKDPSYVPDWWEWDVFLPNNGNGKRLAPEEIITDQGCHPLAILIEREKGFDMRVLTWTEMERLLTKRASKLAQGDRRFQRDLIAMIDSLRKNPYGPGTKKLICQKDNVLGIQIPWRRFDPSERIGLSLQHEHTCTLRVVYGIDKSGSQPVLVLRGIFPHDEFDRRFS